MAVSVKYFDHFQGSFILVTQYPDLFFAVSGAVASILVDRAHLHLQGRKIGERGTSVSKWLTLVPLSPIFLP
jgi:hypothetical protein